MLFFLARPALRRDGRASPCRSAGPPLDDELMGREVEPVAQDGHRPLQRHAADAMGAVRWGRATGWHGDAGGCAHRSVGMEMGLFLSDTQSRG
eukprot:1396666-Prymnesium_polylepis.1